MRRSFEASTRARPQRILSFDEMMAGNPTPAQIASYWPILDAMKGLGMVDEDLNILAKPRRVRGGTKP